jgi:hypothetical protein
MIDIAGRGNEGDRVGSGEFGEAVYRYRCGCSPQFGAVTASELLEPLYVVVVPATQLCAWRSLLEPLVQVNVGLQNTSRPQPVHEDAAGSDLLMAVVVIGAGHADVRVLRHLVSCSPRPGPGARLCVPFSGDGRWGGQRRRAAPGGTCRGARTEPAGRTASRTAEREAESSAVTAPSGQCETAMDIF